MPQINPANFNGPKISYTGTDKNLENNQETEATISTNDSYQKGEQYNILNKINFSPKTLFKETRSGSDMAAECLSEWNEVDSYSEGYNILLKGFREIQGSEGANRKEKYLAGFGREIINHPQAGTKEEARMCFNVMKGIKYSDGSSVAQIISTACCTGIKEDCKDNCYALSVLSYGFRYIADYSETGAGDRALALKGLEKQKHETTADTIARQYLIMKEIRDQ